MFSDFRFALRLLRKNPGFTAAVVLSLGLGIGANATVLCWLRNLVLRPLPGVERQGELAVLASNQGGGGVSREDLEDFAAFRSVFAGATASQLTSACLTVNETPEWIQAQVTSASFFDLLGVRPIAGRTFLPDEDKKPGGNPVLVISERLWRRTFAADPAVIGRTVDLNRHAFTIVGIVPAKFQGTMPPIAFEAWAPLSMIQEVRNQNLDGRNARGWHDLVRLQPGVSVAQANAAVQILNASLAAAHPDTNRDIRHRVVALRDCPWGAQPIMGPVLSLLLAVSAGVLLIVTANVANLLLARSTSRRKEIAIRLAAGAGRWRLVRQMLCESMLLACGGGLVGVLLASWAVNSLPLFMPEVTPGLVLEFALDPVTLGLTLALTLVTGIVFGLVPALQTSGSQLHETLKEGGRSASPGATHHLLRSVLVVVEVALAVVLLVGAGLCLKGMRNALQVDIGLEPDRVLIASMQVGMHGYDRDTGRVFYRQVQERLATIPGVEEASLANWFPLGLGGCKGSNVEVEGHERLPGEDITHEYAIISPRYFATMGIPLVSGRDFTPADDASSDRVAIVNEHFAERFWPGRDAVGQRFRSAGRWRTVVGVARAGKYNRLDEPAHRFFYLPCQQYSPDLDLGLCVRTKGDPAAFAPALREAVRSLDPAVDLVRVVPLARHVEGAFFVQRFAATLLSLLGAVALSLAAMGVYAVMAYAVSQRTQEFGVRMALGARRSDVLVQVLGKGLLLAATGIVIGLGLAAIVTRLLPLEGLLHGASPIDPTAFAGASLVLCAVAALACLMPARRATRVDPMIALRSE
jgi:predicted permease